MRLVVRFDVDTWLCAHKGMPFLIDFAESVDARFSFMVNMGRAVSRGMHLRKLFKLSSTETLPVAGPIAKLGSLERLGTCGYLQTAVLNPMVGCSAGPILHRARDQGHALGLHGGSNHGEWQWGAHSWSIERLHREIAWGVDAFRAIGLPRPVWFSSPGWNSPELLVQVLTEQGFLELHDSHCPGVLNTPVVKTQGLRAINTTFAGEPGGVGYFESALVKGLTAEVLVDTIIARLQAEPGDVGMVYDHPVFCAGVGRYIFCATLDLLHQRGVALVASHSESYA